MTVPARGLWSVICYPGSAFRIGHPSLVFRQLTAMRVLYVDDHTPFRAVVQRRFLAGHDVVGAGTLAEAREHLAARAFDYVLLEYSLPDGKATELICEIREKCLPCKVVAVSQNLEHNAEMVTAGADGVVMKNEFTRLADRLANLEHDQ